MARRKNGKKSKPKSELDPNISQEIVAIVLAALALILLLAIFNVGGFLPGGVFHVFRLTIGLEAFLLPIVLILVAWMLFMPERFESRAHIYAGFTLFVVALAGLLHIGVSNSQAADMATAGKAGGYIGLGLSRGLLSFLNVPASAVILIALILIALVIAFNAKLSDLVKRLAELFKSRREANLQINEPTGIVVNNKLPIRGTLNAGEKEKEYVALTANIDPDWKFPHLDLLEETKSQANAGNIKENANIIQQTLGSFGIDVSMGEVNVGPTVTQYTLKPDSGVKLNKITELQHNLSLALAAHPIRVEAPIPGKSLVGIEVPNKTSATVRMRDLLASPEVTGSKSPLTFVLGRDVAGSPEVANLDKMPHLLIAGATGSGKSVMINSFLLNLLYRNSPSELKLILVDPKRVELSLYNDIPHLLTPVIVEPEKCISALKWAVAEMERRYKLFSEHGKRNISEYNAAAKEEAMPYIVIVIDELADLMSLAASDVEGLIVRLAQMARATGIHLVLATQRPSVNVITGLIKANIPARIAFTVASQVDSRTILDQSGAEKLLGKGDMLFVSPELVKPKRIQGALVDEKEVKGVTDYLRQAREPQYNEEVLTQPVRLGGGSRGSFEGGMDDVDDSLFQEAAELVIQSGKASASLLQRRLRIGYARAARLIDLMEERGIVGPADGARPREILVSSVSDSSYDAEPEE